MPNSGRSLVRGDRFYSPPEMRRYNQKPNFRQPRMTNFDQFLKNTTPIVTARHFPKTCVNERNHECNQPYFMLNDLWDCFREWSAYGAGIPLVLNKSDSVEHYYTPYLSAIQLYVDPSTPVTLTNIMQPDERSISDISGAASSDGSSYEGSALGHEPCAQENNVNSFAPGLLAFEFFENTSQIQRAPFAQRVKELEAEFPELRTFRSCDLTPSSWFSVAWYPIYGVLNSSSENFDSCFLTFHSLSTPLNSTNGGTCVCGPTISLPSFGLTVCNFQSSDWTEDPIHGMEKINSLIQSTDNWLHRLRINHPDYVVFKNYTCSDSENFLIID